MSVDNEKEPWIHPRSLNRRSGRSTRQIDEMVQDLFKHGYTLIYDHADGVDHKGRVYNYALEHTRKRLLQRLKMEHNLSIADGSLNLFDGTLHLKKEI
jgi:hypothetical protein